MKDGFIVKDKISSYSRHKVNLTESSCLMVDEKSSDCKKKKLTSTCVASSSNATHDLAFVFPDELSVDEFDNHRKKRCVDRYDSSESWDSGVATLRCCSESASTSSTSDITEPGSPYNICGQLSEDSNVTFNSTPPTSVFSTSSLPTFAKRPVRNMLPDSINQDENDDSCWEWGKTADWNDKFELTPEDIDTQVKSPGLYHDSNTENVNCISNSMNVGLLDNGSPLNSKRSSNNIRSVRLPSAFRPLPNIDEQMASVHTTPGSQADTLLTKSASRTPKMDYSRKPAVQKEKLPVEESFDFSSFINSSFMNRRCTQSIAPDSNLQTLLNSEKNFKNESVKDDMHEPTEKTISEDKDCIEKKDYCTADDEVSSGNNMERSEEIDPKDTFKPSKVIKRKTYYFDERLCAEDLFNKFPKFLMPILFDDDTSESSSAKLEQLGIKELDESSSDEENGIDFSSGNLFLPKRKITDNNISETSNCLTGSNSKNPLTSKDGTTSETPLLSEPKVIRFPSHQSSPQVSEGLCRWEECTETITLSSKLVEHLQNKHVKPQTFSAEFVCLWSGCKVYGRASCSLSWLERHVLSHAGNKPFRCIVDGCGQSFSSQIILERHINQHFKQNKSNNKPVDSSANKVIRRNGQTLRYRREPYSARGTTDIFDQAIMARMKEMATQSAESCQKYNVDYTCSKTHLNVKFEPQVVAMRETAEYGKQYLVRWCPYNVIDDEWLAESGVKTKHVPIWMLPKDKQDFFWKVVFPYRPEKPVHSARKWKKPSSL